MTTIDDADEPPAPQGNVRLLSPKDGGDILVTVYTPRSFADDIWDYKPGESVTFIAPTGWGKTTFQYRLLAVTATPDLPALALITKPRDETSARWGKRLNFKRLVTFPPPYPLKIARQAKVRGWLLWPPHSGATMDEVEEHLTDTFRSAVFRAYRSKIDLIIMADEILDFVDMGMKQDLRVLWTRGRSAHKGLWGGSQKPIDIPTWAYSQAHHLFLGRDPDMRVIKRYSEIGGVDPEIVKAATLSLRKHEWVYIRRDDQTLCIITRE